MDGVEKGLTCLLGTTRLLAKVGLADAFLFGLGCFQDKTLLHFVLFLVLFTRMWEVQGSCEFLSKLLLG